jgi:hypothetical protein
MAKPIMVHESLYARLETMKKDMGPSVSFNSLLEQVFFYVIRQSGSVKGFTSKLKGEMLREQIYDFWVAVEKQDLIEPDISLEDIMAPLLLLCEGRYADLHLLLEQKLSLAEKLAKQLDLKSGKKSRSKLKDKV